MPKFFPFFANKNALLAQESRTISPNFTHVLVYKENSISYNLPCLCALDEGVVHRFLALLTKIAYVSKRKTPFWSWSRVKPRNKPLHEWRSKPLVAHKIFTLFSMGRIEWCLTLKPRTLTYWESTIFYHHPSHLVLNLTKWKVLVQAKIVASPCSPIPNCWHVSWTKDSNLVPPLAYSNILSLNCTSY